MPCVPLHPRVLPGVRARRGSRRRRREPGGRRVRPVHGEGAAWVIKTTIGWWIDVPPIDLSGSPAPTIRGYVLGLALVVAVGGWGASVAAAGLVRQLWLVVLLLAVGGVFDLVSSIYRNIIMLEACPDQLRGRVQGVRTAVVVGGPRLGDLRAGATAATFGVTGAWVGGGVACVLLVVALAAAVPALIRYTKAQSVG